MTLFSVLGPVLSFLLPLGLVSRAAAAEPVEEIPINRVYEVLPNPEEVGTQAVLETAAKRLGSWKLYVGGIRFNGASLGRVAKRVASGEPYLRAIREQLRMPIDGEDFLYFLDDVFVAAKKGLRGGIVNVPSSRARKAGILLHPDDVFDPIEPRVYAAKNNSLSIAVPKRKSGYAKAKDGDPLGPGWRLRYRNPSGARAKLAALSKARPHSKFRERMESLLEQLRKQGTTAYVTSTVRRRERGYLMWGAFYISRGEGEEDVLARVAKLEARNEEWKLNLPILWRHPDGWEATKTAAREMREAFDVVYATENGARNSHHYDGTAVDIVARALPRKITLQAPDGITKTFDLSAAEESRDLGLTPHLIAWIEEHFQFRKLKRDYPHWNDAAEDPPAIAEPNTAE